MTQYTGYGQAPCQDSPEIDSEFRDVVFEDAVFDNNNVTTTTTTTTTTTNRCPQK